MTRFVCEPASAALRGQVTVPGDKSISHRSLIFAALADGTSSIEGLSSGEDNARTRRALEALGVSFEARGPGAFRVRGVGLGGLTAATDVIDCGNSGTSIRLLCGLLAGQRFTTELCGDESLSKRPMNRVAIPLGMMGADVGGASGALEGEIYPPLVVRGGALHGIDYSSPIASAQVKSAVLLAALYADGPTTVTEPKRSRDHTERMLAGLGAPIVVEGRRITLDPSGWNRALASEQFVVPGDPSSAAFIIVAALLAGGAPVVVENVCGNPTRSGFLDVLARMGAPIAIEHTGSASGEPMCQVTVESAPGELRGVVIDGELTVRAIDEIPILAIAAAFADGVTEIRDGAELRVKESDRIASTAAMLRAFGVEVEERADGMVIEGRGGAPFTAGVVDAHGDHRIAMSAAVAALAARGQTVINDVDNVATSFPTFVDTMTGLGARISRT